MKNKLIYKEILKSVKENAYRIFLYHAKSEQSKTKTYLNLIQQILKTNKKVILLTPEVLSVDILAKDLERLYPDRIAIFHSRLKIKEKRHNLRKVLENQAKVVIGTRSAVFVPVKDLGLIIVDEEESAFYKKPDAPKINSIKVAEIRCELLKCPLVLSSTTPSVESYYKAKKKNYTLIQQRVRKPKIAKTVKIIDLRKEKDIYRRKGFLSYLLRDQIDESLKRNQKAMLFLNRRGFATFIRCKKCGYIARCKRCGKNLTYHYDSKKLICHFCNYQQEPPKICPRCKSAYLSYTGFGTEKLESILYHRYPGKKIKRLDTDRIAKKGQRYKILSEFNKDKIDILVGTQVLFRGIDFINTGVIGIISADSAMHIADFRAQEKTFDMLYNIINQSIFQNKDIKIVIQTYLPEHFAIKNASELNYLAFYKKEIEQRKSLNLPPYYHFNYIALRGKNKKRVIDKAKELSQIIKKMKKGKRYIKVIEAHPLNVSKLRDYYRQKIIIKGKDLNAVKRLVDKSLKCFKKPSGVIVTLDIDAVEYF